MREYILAINPGSTSTKIGIFRDKSLVFEEKVSHDLSELLKYKSINNQFPYLIIKAMVYQVSKQIGAMAAALEGKVRHIILTGGIAHSEMITKEIEKRISFIAPVVIKPGEDELSALNEGVLRVLSGSEKAKIYNENTNMDWRKKYD